MPQNQPVPAQSHNRALGQWGEDQAAQHYQARGFKVLARNWRPHGVGLRGELDLVLLRDRLLVVCEVKTRLGTAQGTPAEAVTRSKQMQLRKLMGLLIDELRAKQMRPFPNSLRIDVACVTKTDIEIIEHAC